MARKSAASFLDGVAWRLLEALQADGRASLKSLAVATGLSVAATAERLKRLQDVGVVATITANLEESRAGYPVKAIVGITAAQPSKKALLDKLRRAPEVIECHHVAGADSYVMIVVAPTLAEVERFVGTINGFGETHTSIVFSTPIERRGIVRPGASRRG